MYRSSSRTWEVRSLYIQTRNFIKEIFKHTDVVLLCGGLGTRLMPVINDRPKPMAMVNQQPFMDILIEYFSSFGFRRFILCTGHMSEKIQNYYRNNDSKEIIISKEAQPLGTAGSIKNAERFILSDPFFVSNGDSFCSLNLYEFYKFHDVKNATVSIAAIQSKSNKDGGSVSIDQAGKIVNFQEKKQIQQQCYINAGIYLFQKAFLSLIQPGVKSSLEYDVFPKLTEQRSFAFVVREKLLDIGTPEQYTQAERYFANSPEIPAVRGYHRNQSRV